MRRWLQQRYLKGTPRSPTTRNVLFPLYTCEFPHSFLRLSKAKLLFQFIVLWICNLFLSLFLAHIRQNKYKELAYRKQMDNSCYFMLLPKEAQISPSSTAMTRVPHKYKGQIRNKRKKIKSIGKRQNTGPFSVSI